MRPPTALDSHPSCSGLRSESERRARVTWTPKGGLRWRSDAGPKSLISRPVTCRCCVVGPDVESGAASGAKGSTKGLFGLNFDDLLRSEWVQDDTITFKVRPLPPPDPPPWALLGPPGRFVKGVYGLGPSFRIRNV